MSHPSINDVAVIGMLLEAEHTEVPRAYVVLAPGIERNDDTAQEIIDWHSKKVANHKKLRGGVRFVDEIPKSAAGKILRRVLKVKMDEEKEQLKAKL
jgi:4-coumarate--CoA ligase